MLSADKSTIRLICLSINIEGKGFITFTTGQDVCQADLSGRNPPFLHRRNFQYFLKKKSKYLKFRKFLGMNYPTVSKVVLAWDWDHDSCVQDLVLKNTDTFFGNAKKSKSPFA